MSKPKVDDNVRVRLGPYDDSPWACATVDVVLSAQFRAVAINGSVVYGLFNMDGDSWKRGW